MTEGQETSPSVADEDLSDDAPRDSEGKTHEASDRWEECEAQGPEVKGDSEEAINLLNELNEEVSEAPAIPVGTHEDEAPEDTMERPSEEEAPESPEEPSEEPKRPEDEEEQPAEEDQTEGGPGPEREALKLQDDVLSNLDLVLATVSILSFAGTIVALKWDTWVGGTTEESIGMRQLIAILVGVVVTLLFAGAMVFNMLRRRPEAA